MFSKNNKQGKKVKVAIIGTVGVPANYGGFETLAEHLIDQMAVTHDITVYCSGKAYPKKERKSTYKSAKLKYIPLEANGIQSIIYDTWSIIHSLFKSDVLLVLGVAGAWILPLVRLLTNKKVIISIDGIEWKRDKWNLLAKCYLFWAESLAVRYSHVDISDNEVIQNYTSTRYGTLSRIIEYGADHTIKVPINQESQAKYNFLNHPYAFKVCRIEPENNVHQILEVFAKNATHIPFVIVGNWDKSDYGKKLKNDYSGFEHIHILDPIYDQQKLDVLRANASLYVHGHSAGGTNPSLVEAMYLGLPILAYGVAYNRVTTENKALYFNTPTELKEVLRQIDLTQLKSIGVTMESIAKRRYTWSKVAKKYENLVEEALVSRGKTNVKSTIEKMDDKDLLSLDIAHLKINKNFKL